MHVCVRACMCVYLKSEVYLCVLLMCGQLSLLKSTVYYFFKSNKLYLFIINRNSKVQINFLLMKTAER